jgi:hypothetical protein
MARLSKSNRAILPVKMHTMLHAYLEGKYESKTPILEGSSSFQSGLQLASDVRHRRDATFNHTKEDRPRIRRFCRVIYLVPNIANAIDTLASGRVTILAKADLKTRLTPPS